MSRVYLDNNATTRLCDEAREAMIEAMALVGNPSSVHQEGRAAKALLERARYDLAAALDAPDADIIWTSGATEAAALACHGLELLGSAIEHDAVRAWTKNGLSVDESGAVAISEPASSVLQRANSETGRLQFVPQGIALCDLSQAFGKIPVSFETLGAQKAILSAHKFGGPKGVGALVLRQGLDPKALLRGGGQEMGWRAGTENLIGIAGMAAAARLAAKKVADGAWTEVQKLRDRLEGEITALNSGVICVGDREERLPNTICLITPGWRGETQVMQFDLAGFALSAGSACSSGKTRGSDVLRAMGYAPDLAGSALRISLGLHTTEDDIARFLDTWARLQGKRAA